jgi:hypothetical protein
MQCVLFPTLEEELGPLTPKHQRIVAVLNLIDIDAQVPAASNGPGRPPKDRRAIASAFVAKAVFNLSNTRQLLDLPSALLGSYPGMLFKTDPPVR